MRQVILFILLIWLVIQASFASELVLSDTLDHNNDKLSTLLKSNDYFAKAEFLNSFSSSDYLGALKSTSEDLHLDSVVVSEWSEVLQRNEKTRLYTCSFEDEGQRVLVRIFRWDAVKNKWTIADENYYHFTTNGKIIQVEFQNYFLPNYLWYTRIDYEYENGLLKLESSYGKIDEIEFWDEIEQIEYIYNNNNSLNTINVNKWDHFENDWVTEAYRKFAYNSNGNLTTETEFDYNFYDVESTKKFEFQYSYDDSNYLIEIVKYIPGLVEGIFEPKLKQENIFNSAAELYSEIFYDWDFDLKFWLADVKKLYFNEAQGQKLFEESSYNWSEENSNWEGSHKMEYLSEHNYFSEDIYNWEFLQTYMPTFSFDNVVCDRIETFNMQNDIWEMNGVTNYYFSRGDLVGLNDKYETPVRVYPNPVIDVLYLEITNFDEMTCVVRNLYGQIVSQNKVQNREGVLLQGLRSGVYIVEISSEGKRIFTQKIIKN